MKQRNICKYYNWIVWNWVCMPSSIYDLIIFNLMSSSVSGDGVMLSLGLQMKKSKGISPSVSF